MILYKFISILVEFRCSSCQYMTCFNLSDNTSAENYDVSNCQSGKSTVFICIHYFCYFKYKSRNSYGLFV